MKAVILEIKDSYAAALSDDGTVIKLRNKNYAVGQKIVLKNNNKFIRLAASAAALIMVFVTPAWAYLTPYSYVSLDVNPSFEFSVNRFDRVIKVTAVNDEGKDIVEEISTANLKNKEINQVVKNVLVELKEKGYIVQGQEGSVVVATSSKSKEKTDELAASLRASIEEEVKESKELKESKEDKVNIAKSNKEEKTTRENETDVTQNSDQAKETKELNKTEKSKDTETEEEKDQKEEKEQDKQEKQAAKETDKEEKQAAKEEVKEEKKSEKKFEVEIIEVSSDEVDIAKSKGVTPGKMNLVGKLQDAALNAKVPFGEEEFLKWLDEPVQDIMKEIKKYSKEAKQESKTEEKKSNNKTDETKEIENQESKNKNFKN